MCYYCLILRTDTLEKGYAVLYGAGLFFVTFFASLGLVMTWVFHRWEWQEYVRVAVMGPLLTLFWLYLSTVTPFFNYCLQIQWFGLVCALVFLAVAIPLDEIAKHNRQKNAHKRKVGKKGRL